MKISEIIQQLSAPVPPEMLGSLKDKGNAPYIPWHNAVQVMDERAASGGWAWEWEVKNVALAVDRIFITGCIRIHAEDGTFCRDATGTEALKKIRGQVVTEQEIAYGDPSSIAESMAKRRAMANWGLGLYLYDKKGRAQHTGHQHGRSPQRIAQNPTAYDKSTDTRPISEGQAKRLYAIASSSGWSHQDVKSALVKKGFESASSLPRNRYDALVEWFESNKKPTHAHV